jgi:hypothetical protein
MPMTAVRSSRLRRGLRSAVLAAASVVVLTGSVACSDPPGDGGVPVPPFPLVGATLSVYQPLPSGEECARRVLRMSWEPRPPNDVANQSVPDSLSLPSWPDYWNPRVNTEYVPRINGKFTGTTDEILWWGACKWGIDVDVVRAMAVEESSWLQSKVGDFSLNPQDCVGNYQVPCPTSFGILQIKHIFRPGSYPHSARHTAFNVDYTLGVLRGCYQGWLTYLQGDYAPGDLWGCVGWHYAGEWKNPLAQGYVDRVGGHLAQKAWRHW